MGPRVTRRHVVQQILRGRSKEPVREQGIGRAPVNIALCKYWGKRDAELNLPRNSSLSVTLPGMEVEMRVEVSGEGRDEVVLEDNRLPQDEAAFQRVVEYLDLFRGAKGLRFRVESRSAVPPAAGLASSAAAFAALVRALDALFGWELTPRELSILARLGSGSACRSIFQGAVVWQAGRRRDGMDSFARPLNIVWPEFRMGLVLISTAEKAVGSRPGMNHTVETSPLYSRWPAVAEQDLQRMLAALEGRDMGALGGLAESNALCMHATMIAARPPLLYWEPKTVSAMKRVWAMRQEGRRVYFTIDAGPNLKLIYPVEEARVVREVFGEVREFAPLTESASCS